MHGSETFVIRKIAHFAGRIEFYLQNVFYHRDVSALRDWEHACSYVEKQWLACIKPCEGGCKYRIGDRLEGDSISIFEQLGLQNVVYRNTVKICPCFNDVSICPDESDIDNRLRDSLADIGKSNLLGYKPCHRIKEGLLGEISRYKKQI
ncbi:MAG TPA: GDP-mannose 4,6-dehydratase [Cyclobacteriaceae bacterium]|nr:GDP-mannose 4,6-dehydratase [Cyclobacteriaceae bacterium]